MRLVSGFAQLKWSVDVGGDSVEVEYGTHNTTTTTTEQGYGQTEGVQQRTLRARVYAAC